jgi:hypothetical protein
MGTVIIYMLIRFGYAGDFLIKNTSTLLGLLPLSQRINSIPEIFYYYIKTFLYPANLSVNQRWLVASFSVQQFYFPLAVDALVLFFLFAGGAYVYIRQKKRFLLYVFFFAWFLCGMGLLLQIFPLDMTVAERWFYFPMVGLLGMLGIILQIYKSRLQRLKKLSLSIALIIIILLSVRTIERNADWHDEFKLFVHDSQISTNFDLETSIGMDYDAVGDERDAVLHLKKAVDLYPDESDIYDLGVVYAKLWRLNESKKYLLKFLSTKSKLGYDYRTKSYISMKFYAYTALARIYYLNNDYINGSTMLKKVTVEFPNSGELWYYLALFEYNLHDRNSVYAAKKALALVPNTQTNILYKLTLKRGYTRYDLGFPAQPQNNITQQL